MMYRGSLETVLEGATIYDGTGRVPYHADVGIAGGKIVAIGDLGEAEAGRRESLRSLALSPGFIDVHTHADLTAAQPEHPSLLEPMVRQGITTVVGGNCGVNMAPVGEEHRESQMAFYDFFLGAPQEEKIHWRSMGEFFEVLEKQGVLLNMGLLAPHGIIRLNVLGDRPTLATRAEAQAMKRVVAECMEAGCLGLSTGLMYFPGLFSDTAELTELAREVHRYNGVFTSHLRSYNSDTLEQAVEEVLTVGREAEVPVQISHLFWIPNYGRWANTLLQKVLQGASWLYNRRPYTVPLDAALRPVLERVAGLRRQGVPVGIDAMPTSAGFTHLFAFFPPWSVQGSRQETLNRLRDREIRARIRRSIEEGEPLWPHREGDSWSMNFFQVMGWSCGFVMSVVTEKNQQHLGKSLAQLGEEQGKHPFDAACDLLLEEEGRVLIFETATDPGDPFIEATLLPVLTDPNVSIATDAILLGFGLPSHLFYDCYPRFLGGYTREEAHLPLSEAIRKCTSLPASQLQIRHRGRIEEGYYADLVVFDPGRIRSCSTAADPRHWPEGVEYVLINGHFVLDKEGFHPEPRPGHLLR